MAELNYTTQDILNQQFTVKMRGYDPDQVDEYLDNIIHDYETQMRRILELEEENARLQAKISNIAKVQKVVAPAASERASSAASRSATAMNFDILKRLSNLEREVFGNKVENKAKAKVVVSFGTPTSGENTVFEEPEIDDQATRLL